MSRPAKEIPRRILRRPSNFCLRHLEEVHQLRSRSWLDMPCSKPASLLPDIHVFGIRPAFERLEIGKFNGENESMPVRLRPAKFDLALTVPAMYEKFIV